MQFESEATPSAGVTSCTPTVTQQQMPPIAQTQSKAPLTSQLAAPISTRKQEVSETEFGGQVDSEKVHEGKDCEVLQKSSTKIVMLIEMAS